MARHRMVAASRMLDCSPSAASSADAPSVVVVDAARSWAVVASASPGWLGSGAAVADARAGMRRVVGDGIARRVPYWMERERGAEAVTARSGLKGVGCMDGPGTGVSRDGNGLSCGADARRDDLSAYIGAQ